MGSCLSIPTRRLRFKPIPTKQVVAEAQCETSWFKVAPNYYTALLYCYTFLL